MKKRKNYEFIKGWKENVKKEEKKYLLVRTEAFTQAVSLAKMLYSKFSAKRVFLFGSLLDKDRFSSRSDIDLAVEGLPGAILFDAMGELLLRSNFPVNLIPLEDCNKFLKQNIITTGKLL